MTQLDVRGTKRAVVAQDNYFWLEPGESRELTADVLWREKPAAGGVSVQVWAWNAPAVTMPLAVRAEVVRKMGK